MEKAIKEDRSLLLVPTIKTMIGYLGMRKHKKKSIIEIKNPKKRTGHYNYQDSRTRIDSRPRKLRTRKSINDKEIGEQK